MIPDLTFDFTQTGETTSISEVDKTTVYCLQLFGQ